MQIMLAVLIGTENYAKNYARTIYKSLQGRIRGGGLHCKIIF